jgi:hypothetical protein
MDEDLPRVFANLRDLTGRTAPEQRGLSPAKSAPQADARLSDYYDDETTEIVTRLFAEDFRQLGYPTR